MKNRKRLLLNKPSILKDHRIAVLGQAPLMQLKMERDHHLLISEVSPSQPVLLQFKHLNQSGRTLLPNQPKVPCKQELALKLRALKIKSQVCLTQLIRSLTSRVPLIEVLRQARLTVQCITLLRLKPIPLLISNLQTQSIACLTLKVRRKAHLLLFNKRINS